VEKTKSMKNVKIKNIRQDSTPQEIKEGAV
jgi:hypothetical protein